MRPSSLLWLIGLHFALGSFGCFAFAQGEETSPVASNEHFNLQSQYFKGDIGFGLEFAQIQSDNGTSLTGIGPRLSVDYDLGRGFSVCPAIALVAEQSGSYLYSGIGGFLRYSVTGNLQTMRQVLTADGKTVMEQTVGRLDRFSVGLGAEQLLINGTNSIYPAAGLSAQASYSFLAWGKRFEVSGRYSSLTTNFHALNSIFFDFSYLLGL